MNQLNIFERLNLPSKRLPKYYSFSALQSFKKCPAQYHYRYIDKIYKKDEGIEAFMGKRVHESIEHLYKQKMSGQLLSYDKLIDYYRSIWDTSWHDRIGIVYKNILPDFKNKNISNLKKQ